MSRSITKSSCYQDALDLARWFQAQVRPRSRKRSSLVMAGFSRVSRSFLGPFYRGWSAWNIFAMVDRGCWLVLICVVGMFNMFQSCSIIFGIARENEPWMTSIFAQGGWSHKPSSFGSRFQGCSVWTTWGPSLDPNPCRLTSYIKKPVFFAKRTAPE